jgi:CheY-like chemotaxis protein
MGGGIVVESELGKGSAFEVRLPLERADAAAQPAMEDQPAEAFTDCRLLLVDSNPLSQSVVRAVLAPKLKAIEAAACAETAAGAAAQARFDLALADGAVLPDAPADRFRAARELAEAVAPAPLVLMVAGLKDGEAGALLAAGVAQVVRKPITAPTLVAELAAGFAARQRVAAAAQTAAAG